MTTFEVCYLVIALLGLTVQILALADQVKGHKRH